MDFGDYYFGVILRFKSPLTPRSCSSCWNYQAGTKFSVLPLRVLLNLPLRQFSCWQLGDTCNSIYLTRLQEDKLDTASEVLFMVPGKITLSIFTK